MSKLEHSFYRILVAFDDFPVNFFNYMYHFSNISYSLYTALIVNTLCSELDCLLYLFEDSLCYCMMCTKLLIVIKQI